MFSVFGCQLGEIKLCVCYGRLQEPKTKNSNSVRKLRMGRNKTPNTIWMKFCRMVDVHDILTCAYFDDDRVRDLGLAGGQILPFPLTLIVVLTTLSHYTVRVCETTDSSFMLSKTSAIFRWVHPVHDAKYRWIGYRRFSTNILLCYISELVQDRDIVSLLWKANSMRCIFQ